MTTVARAAGRRAAARDDGGLAGPVLRRHRLGAELRRLREARSLRLEDAAAELGVAASTLSRIETGQAPARASYVALLLDLYGLTSQAERSQLIDLAREGQRKGWWTEFDHLLPAGAGNYLGLECAASAIRTFALQAVPGLLQTSDYALAYHRATAPGLRTSDARSLAAITLHRQGLLRDGHRLHAIIDEAALSRSIGSAPIMAGQMEHLRDLAGDLSITVQILSLSGPHALLSAPFTLLSFPAGADPETACRRGADGQFVLTRDDAGVSAMRDAFGVLARAAMTAEDSARVISQLAQRR